MKIKEIPVRLHWIRLKSGNNYLCDWRRSIPAVAGTGAAGKPFVHLAEFSTPAPCPHLHTAL